MFLNTKKLKSLMKDAYNGCGLKIGRYDKEWLYIEAGYWAVWIKTGFIPKEIRAYIIELGGEYPELGQAYSCHKKEPNQYELMYNWDVIRENEKADKQVRLTRTLVELYDKQCRLTQMTGGELIPVMDKAVQAVENPTKEDYELGECDQGDAMCINNQALYWANNVCFYKVRTVYIMDGDRADLQEFLDENRGKVVW